MASIGLLAPRWRGSN
ncbi:MULTISPECIES: hypothetical protein [unclassified Caulobacter]|nr:MULTISPECIES: hypothetical protein [unclassified Caulobacter]HJV42799.1 hypothetical protein [Caulobacter sp.]